MTGYGTVLDTAPATRPSARRPGGRRVLARRAGGAAVELVLPQLDGGPPGRARRSPRGARVEHEATRLMKPGTYLEPFALRALGIVREDGSLVERAAERFAELGLDWHAARTRELL